MSIQKQPLLVLIVMLGMVSLMVVACAPAGVPPAEGDMSAASQTEEALSSEEIERRKTAIFNIDGGAVADPELWNPFVPGHRRDQGWHQSMMEPLFVLNYGGFEDIQPWLGESMTANETLDVWTLKVRDGITWSDGEAFNADDVVFTAEMLLPNPELNDWGLRQWVTDVEKIDDLTVQFTLNKPNPRFQLDIFTVKIWGSIPIVPEHIWADQDPLTFKFYDPEQGWPVYTGPYNIVSISESEFVYERDDNWWGATSGWRPLPRPEKLVWIWAGTDETRVAMMAENELDSLMDITLGAYLALRQRNPNVITWFADRPYIWPDPCPRNLEINTTVEPWNDKDMRWALNHAINRQDIVDIGYEGTSVPSRLFYPPYPLLTRYEQLLEDAGLFEKYPIGVYDPDRAKEIIESKGWTIGSNGYYEKDGQELGLVIQTHESFIELQRLAQIAVENLQANGINASMQNLGGAAWGDNLRNGTFEASSGWQTCGSVSEPWASMDTFNAKWVVPVGERASRNFWRWENEEYSAIVDEIGSLPLNDPKIDELFVEAMTIWLDEMPLLPAAKSRKLIPFNTTYWTNWPTDENNYMVGASWIQNAHVIIHNIEPTNP